MMLPPVIDAQGAENLKKYKYVGADLSLLYTFALSPLAQFCVDTFIPRWMAPNVITSLGLAVSAVSALVAFYHCPNYVGDDESTPRWIYLLASAGLLIYQTLDNMDGKQARKTGSSSPLGLLFDHGCDAFNSALGAQVMLCILSVSPANPLDILLVMSTTIVPFYWATWEEYYVDALILPYFNGPSEGVMGGAICGVITFFVGPSFWQTPVPLPAWAQWDCLGQDFWTPTRIMLYPIFVAEIITIVYQTTNVCLHLQRQKHKRRAKEEESGSTELAPSSNSDKSLADTQGSQMPKLGIMDALTDLLPFIVYVVLGVIYVHSSPELMREHPKAMVFLLYLLVMDMEVCLMRHHLCRSRFTPFRRLLVPLPLVCANSALSLGLPVWPLHLAYLVLAAVWMAVLAYRTVVEVRNVLGIWCFSLRPRNQPSKKLT